MLILLTTNEPIVGTLPFMGKRPVKTSGAAVVEVYAKRQLNRPHYLLRLMARHGVSRADIIEGVGVDKSLLARWLASVKPTTPGPIWATKLGEFFGNEDGPVDIFADPDIDYAARLLRDRSSEEKERIIAMIEAAFPKKAPNSR